MRRYQSLSFIAGILGVVCYLMFALIAYSRYPLPYSPVRNWLSDLGNVNLNPSGAILYNTGIILTAALLVVFFIGLSKWKMENKKAQIIMVVLTQVFGILGAVFMIMSALFPINLFEIHSFWSSALYIMLSTGFAFSVAALRYYPKVPSWLLVLGLSTPVMVILTSILTNVYLLEWITVPLLLSYVSLLGVETKRHQEEPFSR